jgi:hypothetical protein
MAQGATIRCFPLKKRVHFSKCSRTTKIISHKECDDG